MKYFFTLVMSMIITLKSESQEKDELNYRIHFLTTIVKAQGIQEIAQGTGFFYNVIDTLKSNAWSKINGIWLITNRHIVLQKDFMNRESLPELFTFYMRKLGDSSLLWEPIQLSANELRKRLKIFEDSTIDVVAIDVQDLLMKKTMSDKSVIQWQGVSKNDLPDENPQNIQVTDDVSIVGFPLGFYDNLNLFPIVKTGSIASRWGFGYNGNPYFLIDAKLFPGSSGSIVISKPANFMVDTSGTLFSSKSKQYIFLGIYSGEPHLMPTETFDTGDLIIQKKRKYDVGIVWYSSLIPELVEKGVRFNK